MIEKLIAEFPNDEKLEKDWQAAKAKAIVEYQEYIPGRPGGFLQPWIDSRYENRPDIGAAKIAAQYPNGAKDYLKDYKLSGDEARDLCHKVDLLIEAVNKLTQII